MISPGGRGRPMRRERVDRQSSFGSSNSIRSRSLSPHRAASPSSSSAFSWALMTPTFGSQPSSKPLIRRTPVLTVLLKRLEHNMSSYCAHLAAREMKEAAALLDSSVATASPTAAPTSRVSGSAMALESEWDTYVSPFLLLSGAESLYFSLAPSNHLVDLYKRIADDLVIVKQRLCDVFLQSDNSFYAVANSLATTLQILVTFCESRIQLTCMMKALLLTKDLEFVQHTCTSLLQDNMQAAAAAAHPLMASLDLEVKHWLRCAQLCQALDACRFTETVLTLRQMHVAFPEESPMQHWWKHFREVALSLMPIYFDQIRASARLLYGFDPYKLAPKQDAKDVAIQDFLKRQEGYRTAVLVVLNNTGASNFEYGHGQPNKPSKDSKSVLQEWTVCYYRKTAESTPLLSSRGLSSIKQLGRKVGTTMSSTDPVDVSSIRRPEDDMAAKPTSNTGHPSSAVDAQSWPFTEWKELVSVLNDGGSMDSVVTYKPSDDMDHPNKVSLDFPPTTWSPTSSMEQPVTSTSPTNTTFHIISLSPRLWMVVAVNGIDGKGKWSRSRGLSDSDIRSFLDTMAKQLRISSFFDDENVEAAMQDAKQGSKLPVKELDGDMQVFLTTLKISYGLRSQSPMVGRLRSPYRSSGPPAVSKVGLRKKRRGAVPVDDSESAMAFFLGNDLLQHLR